MPGITSLKKQKYYAHPRNNFWKIIYTLFNNISVSVAFNEKISFLKMHRIGLWDVLENCERKGSLDVHIKNQTENDFESLFQEFPGITKIAF
jgi:hypoxanthine-DNA glycosylase